MVNEFSSVNPLAQDTLTFDFLLELSSSEILTGTPTLTVSTIQSTDAAAATHFGVPAVNGTTVTVSFSGLIVDVNYWLEVSVSTSTSRVLVCTAVLPCRDN